MGVEQAIRDKHAFRERLQAFLSIAVTMSNDEIEIALGRLVDMLAASEDENAKLDIKVKGAALKLYFDLRLAGEVRQNKAKRNTVVTDDAKSTLAHKAHEEAVQKWKAEGRLEREKWQQQPFLKRLFGAGPPNKPEYWYFYDTVSTSDAILATLAAFELMPKGVPEPEVTPEEVKLLSMQSK